MLSWCRVALCGVVPGDRWSWWLDAKMTIASFVISVLAVVVAAAAVWYGRGQKRAADLSAAEATRSADAAAQVADIERVRREEEVAAAKRRRVRFVIVKEGGQAHLLRNVGTDTAYEVHVDTGGMGVQDEITDFDEFEAGSEHRYLLARTMGPGQTDHVVVTWHHLPDRSDEQRIAKLLGP
jgi:hypothetical protein